MRMLDRPTLTIEQRDGGRRVLVIEASTGELIGVELEAEEASRWAELIGPSALDSEERK